MIGAVERSATALKAFKQIIRELKKSDKSFSRDSQQFKFLMKEMRGNQVTQRMFSRGSNEIEHVAGLYATYLSSTRKLIELQQEYRGGERSIEESARLVGLTLPPNNNHS